MWIVGNHSIVRTFKYSNCIVDGHCTPVTGQDKGFLTLCNATSVFQYEDITWRTDNYYN